MVSASLLAVLILTAIFAPLIAPQNPYDGAALDMWKAELPPLWEEGGEWPFLLGTDTQGRDMLSAILYGTRISIVIGIASVILSLIIGLTAGLISGYFGGFIDNLLMRFGDITLSIPTILVAILVSTVVRQMLPVSLREIGASAVLILAISLSAWVQYARTVRAGDRRNRQGLRFGSAADRGAGAADHGPAYPAQHPHTHHGRRDAEFRDGDPDRGDTLLPGYRHAAEPAVTGNADPYRQSVPVLRLLVDRGVSRHSALPARGCRQYAR